MADIMQGHTNPPKDVVRNELDVCLPFTRGYEQPVDVNGSTFRMSRSKKDHSSHTAKEPRELI